MEATIPVLILALPLIMFLFLGLFGNKLTPRVSGIIGTTSMGVVMILAYYTAYLYFFSGNPQFIDGDGHRLQAIIFNQDWLAIYDNLVIRLGFLLDPISALMLVVITTISFMVHLYSNGYMRDHHGVYERGFQRFYAFLSLFSFSMLGLVVATNIFQMYIFWELVGASSYLLIGFYYTKPAAVSASKKAFIVTRFADLGFLIGILILSYFTGTFNFTDMTSAAVPGMDNTYQIGLQAGNIFSNHATQAFLGGSLLTVALVLIFMGGMGKSAMLPLHIWLPDAMEGPTPVSALIHAATMVVAGVYLVARLFPLYLFNAEAGGWALDFVTIVGALTALYAAMVACAQLDIKRVLAFSTISQIAFMMVSLGVSRESVHENLGFMASMFHLFTHAMFKALLFLGAGAIIHAVGSNDYTSMHGLRKYMPKTHITFLVGCLAIAGIIPFSGFFSKDEILSACVGQSIVAYIWMSLVAGLTAFYMFRLYFLIFWWKDHKIEDGHHAPSDQPWTMTVPLILLAVVATLAGLIPFGKLVTWNGEPYEIHLDWTVASISLLVAIVAILIAAKMYMKENPLPEKMRAAMPTLWRWCRHRMYWDELYMFITHRIIFDKICRPIAWFDRHIIDGTMDMFANVTNKVSFSIRGLQSGNVQSYVLLYLLGALILGGGTVAIIFLFF